MNDLRLYLLGRATRPTSANDQILSRSAGPPDAAGARLHRTADARRPKRSRVKGSTARTTTTSPTVSSCSRYKELSQRMASVTFLRPNSRWFGRFWRSRQVPQLASFFVAKLVVPGTDGPSIGGRGHTRCHSRENRGVYSPKAVREKRRLRTTKR
jgi:hypothetical protein